MSVARRHSGVPSVRLSRARMANTLASWLCSSEKYCSAVASLARPGGNQPFIQCRTDPGTERWDASAEIELSTQQQTTAVEQVSMAAADTARVAKQTEATVVQTRQTAAHLASLSANLQNLAGAGAA